MLERLVPSTAGFTYRGNRVALGLLGIILLMKIGIALGSIFNGYYAASVADGIPIDTYTPQGANTVVALLGALGVSQLVLCAVGALVLVKYRALVPIFILFLLAEYVARKGVSLAMPITRSGGAPGGAINWAVFAVMLVALALALRQGSTAS
jgi:hypothetical protein